MKKKNQNRYFLLLMLMATALPVFSQEGGRHRENLENKRERSAQFFAGFVDQLG